MIPSMIKALAVIGITGGGLLAQEGVPAGISTTTPVIDESTLLSALAKAAMGNCFAGSIRVGGLETCTIGIYPMVCLRMRNNYPSDVLEASFTYQHLSVVTSAGWHELSAESPPATPGDAVLGRDGDEHSGSAIAFGRTIASPLLATAVFSVANGVAWDTLCQPRILGEGYLFLSDADQTPQGMNVWRGAISPYWYHALTAPVTGLAKSLEAAGACGLDFTYFLCFGGYDTVLPGHGANPAASPALALLAAMWRAQEIDAPAWPTYGIYGTSLGPLVWSLHLPQAYGYGVAAQVPKYSPGSYLQWLWPGMGGVGIPDTTCSVLGAGPGTVPAMDAEMVAERLNGMPLDDQTLSYFYWSRWTCCTYCEGSDEAAARQLIPEQSFLPTLTRIP